MESHTLVVSQPGTLAGAVLLGYFYLGIQQSQGSELGGCHAWSAVSILVFFFPALIAFQVMIKARQPHRWVYAGLCWSLSHTRFVLPRSPGCAQLLC